MPAAAQPTDREDVDGNNLAKKARGRPPRPSLPAKVAGKAAAPSRRLDTAVHEGVNGPEGMEAAGALEATMQASDEEDAREDKEEEVEEQGEPIPEEPTLSRKQRALMKLGLGPVS